MSGGLCCLLMVIVSCGCQGGHNSSARWPRPLPPPPPLPFSLLLPGIDGHADSHSFVIDNSFPWNWIHWIHLIEGVWVHARSSFVSWLSAVIWIWIWRVFFSCCCVFFLGEIPPVEWEKCDAIFYGHFRFAFIGQQHTHTHTNDKTFLKWNEIRQFEQI